MTDPPWIGTSRLASVWYASTRSVLIVITRRPDRQPSGPYVWRRPSTKRDREFDGDGVLALRGAFGGSLSLPARERMERRWNPAGAGRVTLQYVFSSASLPGRRRSAGQTPHSK